MAKILDNFLGNLILNPWDRNKIRDEIIRELVHRDKKIEILEGVVECAKKWSDDEAKWQAHKTNCDECEQGTMCSEEWIDFSFAVIEAWKDTWTALAKLEEDGDE